MRAINKIIKRINKKTRRFFNIQHAYDFASVNDGWLKYPYPVLSENNNHDSFFDPFIIKRNNVYELFVSHRENNSIMRFSSKDGIEWNNKQTILNSSNEQWEIKVNRACVLIKDNRWYMWYTGQNTRNSSIGLATSEDGIHFNKYTDNPVIKPTEKYELCSVMNPCVIWDEAEKVFKMWYSAGEQYEPDVLCYATSKDGIKWDKYSSNPIFEKSKNEYDKAKVGGCDVIKIDNKYIMFYIGYQNVDTARICVAKSEDGINWSRIPNNPIISPSRNKWDSHAVYKPSVYFDKKRNIAYLWYNGRNNNIESIGMAYKKVASDNKL